MIKIYGSWDSWKTGIDCDEYINFNNKRFVKCKLHIKSGIYEYKYLIDNSYWTNDNGKNKICNEFMWNQNQLVNIMYDFKYMNYQINLRTL